MEPMTPGDPIAVRRLEFGLALFAEGAAAAAAEAFAAALTVDPGYADARFKLAEALESLGETGGAVTSYEAYRALEPEDRLGAVARLARLGAVPLPDRLPAAYVRSLFDQYAPRFDRALLGPLDYRAPELLRAAVLAARGPGAPPMAVLDLGCGTGLAGMAFLDLASRLDGIDLSPAMIGRAAARGIYDSLLVADLIPALAEPGRRWDLILAADVLIYLGDLAPVMAGVARALAPGGCFAFTVERSEQAPVVLGERLRFAHHERYLAGLAESCGLTVLGLDPVAVRCESGRPVPGLVGVFARPAEVPAGIVAETLTIIPAAAGGSPEVAA